MHPNPRLDFSAIEGGPRLEIFKSEQTVFFIWPADYRDFVLEGTDALLPFAIWTTVIAPRREQDSAIVAQLPATDSAKFYRLRAP